MGFLPISFLPFPELIQRLPIPAMRRIRRGITELDALIYGMIAKRRNDPAGLGDRGDLLSMLMQATDPEDSTGTRMTDHQLHDECLTILLAGHETTANGLSFALWLLAKHPEVQAKVSAEARRVLGTRTPAAEDYGQLRYTTQVFSEALRLYPPVWVTARTCHEPYTIAGYTIPRGAVVLAPQYVVHRDPRFFPEPLEFDPSRFTEEQKASRPRYAFFPFAGGSRQCIGEGLAWMEGVFVLAVIARDWRLTLPPGSTTEIEINPSISLRPQKPVMLRLEKIE
jgi:cytochrome P450